MNFKKSLLNLSVVLLAVGGMNAAYADNHDARGGHQGKQKGGEHRLAGKFKRLDADESGAITLDEMTANIADQAQQKLTRADSDASGAISLEEYLAAKPHAHDFSAISDALVECVAAIKAESGDDNIVVPEASKFTSPEAKFAAIDANSDGGITLDELQTHMQTQIESTFAAMDADSNGEVTLDEFTAAAEVKKATKQAVKQCAEELLDDEE
ncbi:EF-hand domain-containing protein [Pseudoalteromonas xiamenensis]